jgi:nitroreductase
MKNMASDRIRRRTFWRATIMAPKRLPHWGSTFPRSRDRCLSAYLLSVETWDVLRARRNVRGYTGQEIPGEHLDRILEAARRTPSSVNQQAWDFVVVTDRDRLRELSKMWRYAAHVADSAATIALVIPTSDDRDERDTLLYDIGQVTMSIMLAAADLGIGSGHASVGDQALARRILGLPDARECPILIALGYPAGRRLEPMMRPKRRPFDEVVHRETW